MTYKTIKEMCEYWKIKPHLDMQHDLLFEIIQKQQARIEELEKQQEWQPIETAPKDGTEIIITNGFDVCTGKYAKSLIQNDHPFFVESVNGKLSNDGFDWEDRPIYIYKPTHWQPLPQPPKQGDRND